MAAPRFLRYGRAMKVNFSLPYRPAEAPDEVFEAQFEASLLDEGTEWTPIQRRAVIARAREFIAELEAAK